VAETCGQEYSRFPDEALRKCVQAIPRLRDQLSVRILLTVEETTFNPTLTALSARFGRFLSFLPPALLLPLTLTEPVSPTS
jgi:hypothetical protein